MIHYHGTPITPRTVLYSLAGKHFCVSFASPQDVEVCHQIGQGVLIDNGAFPLRGKKWDEKWDGYYSWVKPWLDYRTTWCVIPDVIRGTETDNDRLIAAWFVNMGSYRQAAPVWHLHESFDRLERLVNGFERVCLGSSGEYWTVGSNAWNNRVNEAFNRICRGSGCPPAWIHMLRGMSLSGSAYPFSSVDSTDVARNHNRPQNKAKEMADKWDALQTPALWKQQPVLQALEICETRN